MPKQEKTELIITEKPAAAAKIASALGKSEGAIRVIQHRALKKMRNILEEEKGLD